MVVLDSEKGDTVVRQDRRFYLLSDQLWGFLRGSYGSRTAVRFTPEDGFKVFARLKRSDTADSPVRLINADAMSQIKAQCVPKDESVSESQSQEEQSQESSLEKPPTPAKAEDPWEKYAATIDLAGPDAPVVAVSHNSNADFS